MKKECEIGVFFIAPPSGALGEPPESVKLFKERRERIIQALTKLFPEVEFHHFNITSLEEVSDALSKTRDSVGYIVFLLNSLYGLVRAIIGSEKPTILIAETYGAAGDLLLEYSRAKAERKRVTAVITRDIENEKLLQRYVRYLYTIYRLQKSRVLFIVSPGVKTLLNGEFPLSIDLYSYLKQIQSIFGITSLVMNSEEFVDKYYDKVSNAEARAVAEEWIKRAERVLEDDRQEIIKSAKLYIAMKKAVKDHGVDAIAIDCIILYRNGFLDAWPCLGFMELIRKDGIVPVCEADAYSAALLLLMKHLSNRPGFINDPSPDVLNDEIVYYHCFAPVTPYEYCGEKEVPYVITSAHLGGKKASIYVEAPTGEEVTLVGLSPEERILTIHTAKVLRNEYSQHSCSTKIICKANTKAIIDNYAWRAGWHRVLFYGNWREELKDIASLLGLTVIEEDTKG
ncbi:fucose isomerase [Candidatus Bathyarchaeota archaeon]|nr:fucose isomerase [Candidatus Bathyarchaeota archaeon]